MAFFGTGTPFSRSYNTTLTGNPHTPPTPSTRSPQSAPKGGSNSPVSSPEPQDTVTLSGGSGNQDTVSEAMLKIREQVQEAKQQQFQAQLEMLKKQFGP